MCLFWGCNRDPYRALAHVDNSVYLLGETGAIFALQKVNFEKGICRGQLKFLMEFYFEGLDPNALILY